MRVLVVALPDLRDARRLFEKDLKGANGTFLVAYDLKAGVIVDDAWRLYGAEACTVGLSKKHVEALTGQYTCSKLTSIEGTSKSAQAKVRAWIRPPEFLPANPTYEQIAQHRARGWPRLRLVSAAFRHANRVSCAANDSADGFPAFLGEAVEALGKLSEQDGLKAGTLADYFATAAPLANFASSGNETVVYTFEGRSHRTKLHLKAKSERRGYHASEIKPRLYFACSSDAVLLLYFGPHFEGELSVAVSEE